MAERSINNQYDLLLIGGSAGGLDVIIHLLPQLRPHLDLAIVIILHRKPGESMLVELLRDKSSYPCSEVEEKDNIEPNHVYVAPSDYHLLIEKDKSFSLDFSEKVHYSRPAIDVTFETAAEAYGSSTIAILLSGANSDGAEGLHQIKKAGGLTIVQNPEEAAVSYMPEQALNLFKPDYICSTEEMAKVINNLNL